MTIAVNLKIEENPFAQQLGIKEWQKRAVIPPNPEEYLMDELIPANALVSLQASGVFGKTTLATQLAMSVAFGLPFLDRYPCLQPGKVLYINARDTDEDSHRRFKRLSREWTSVPALSALIDENLDNFTHISLFDECFGVSPHLIDVSGSMTIIFGKFAWRHHAQFQKEANWPPFVCRFSTVTPGKVLWINSCDTGVVMGAGIWISTL